ncbi:hypothetical protein ACS0TY_017917 [Phlomoides rotata]
MDGRYKESNKAGYILTMKQSWTAETRKHNKKIGRKVLEDAEDKQFQSKSIQNWLSELNGLVFEIEDLLDECATEVSKLKRKGGKFNLKYKMGKKIKEAVEKLGALAEDRHRFQLQEIVVLLKGIIKSATGDRPNLENLDSLQRQCDLHPRRQEDWFHYEKTNVTDYS